MEEISPTKQNILKYLDYKGISKAVFCRETGISYENFKGKSLKSDIGGAILGKIITIYSDISAEWLLTGKGSMLKPETPPEYYSNTLIAPLLDRIETQAYKIAQLEIEIKSLREPPNKAS